MDFEKVGDIARWSSASEPRAGKIYKALGKVMAGLRELGKTEQNKAQGWNYRGIDGLQNLAHGLMESAGVIVLPHVLSEPQITLGPVAKSGTQFYRSLVKMSFEFLSTEDGSSVVSGPFVGEGIDNSDKASNCAQTAAYKWCFFQTFCIPITGIAVDSEAATELDEDLASEQGGDKPKKKRTSKPASKPPPEQSAEDSKDDRHRKELHEIANTLANGNADAYHAHIRTWTTYKTKDKDEKPVERYCTKASDTYPDGNFILQGKRLDIALSNARDALAASEQ